MTNKYLELFTELAHTNELLAEQVMEYDYNKGDSKAEQSAQLIRDNFRALGDKLKTDSSTLNRADYSRLIVGAYAALNTIQSKIAVYEAAVNGYKTDLIPKLQRILNEAKTEEEVNNLADELFSEKSEN